MANTSDADLSGAAAPLDLLLSQAALGNGPQLLSPGTTFRLVRALASRPRRVLSRASGLGTELGRVAVGSSTVAPSKRDKRFADPAWEGNPLLRRAVQAYLATGEAVEGIAQDVPLPWRDAERVRFAASNLVDAIAPSNNPFLNPAAYKAAIDTGGLSALRGLRNLVGDLSTPPRVPSMVDRKAMALGRDLATSPGAVVLRTPVFELLHYAATTPTVRAEPIVVVPPTINKFYVLDLSPGRSLVEHLVNSGQQVLLVSWRNPDARHSKWGLDTYVQAILEALEAAREICGADRAHLMAACSGGILASVASAVLAQTGQLDTLATLTLLVTVIDQDRAGTTGALVDADVARSATAASRRKGYLDGRQLAEVFAWLRPNDLIWRYWVNNYIEGRQPPTFDILAWNADTTRMTARLHADFMHLAMENLLVRPGGLTVLGHEIDLRKIDVDSYVVAGVSDHLCAWQSCFRSAQLLGGDCRFVLSTNGHIAALVNPPGGRSSYVAADEPLDHTVAPEAWQAASPTEQGSWWPDHSSWLAARSGPEVEAPSERGGAHHRVLESAPGSYVLDQ